MNIHEGRLRAMIDPDTGRGWDINDEDKDAIRWAIASIGRLKAEREEVRAELSRAHLRHWDTLDTLRRLRDDMGGIIQSASKVTP